MTNSAFRLTRHGHRVTKTYWVSDAEVIAAVREVGKASPGTPTTSRYTAHRRTVLEREGRLLPAIATILRRRSWADWLKAADVHVEAERVREWSNDDLRAAVGAASQALGRHPSTRDYRKWRCAEIAAEPRRSGELPSATTIVRRIGWPRRGST